MSETTNISWCDSTANPVIGCSKVSPGCAHCYAVMDTPARVLRHRGIETWGANAQRYAVKGFEKQMLAFNRKPWVCDRCGPCYMGETWPRSVCATANCGGDVHRRRVFVGSNCDILDPAWPSETLAHTLDVIRRCPDIVTILCTKRPELWRARMDAALQVSVPERVWVLTSVENQDCAHRLDALRMIPAAVRGVSFEPLLGPVAVRDWTGIDWVIVGGESGPKARPCNIEWIRSLKSQAQDAGVAVFIKQMGSWLVKQSERDNPWRLAPFKSRSGADPSEWPEDLRVREWPKGGSDAV